MVRIGKEAAVAYIKVLYRTFLGESEEKHEN
jgi:hypothetical protein